MALVSGLGRRRSHGLWTHLGGDPEAPPEVGQTAFYLKGRGQRGEPPCLLDPGPRREVRFEGRARGFTLQGKAGLRPAEAGPALPAPLRWRRDDTDAGSRHGGGGSPAWRYVGGGSAGTASHEVNSCFRQRTVPHSEGALTSALSPAEQRTDPGFRLRGSVLDANSNRGRGARGRQGQGLRLWARREPGRRTPDA